MIIQKMNNALVKHGKVTFTFFTVIIIISFVWYFAPGRDGSMFFGGMRGANSKYGEVLGQSITVNDVRDAAQAMRLFRSVYLGGWGRVGFEEKEAFSYAAALKVADAVGVQASDEEVRNVIRSLPAFQQDGQFSEDLYIKYKNDYLAPDGFGFSDLEEAVRTELRVEKVTRMGVQTSVLTDGEKDAFAEMMLSKISYHKITFDPESFADKAADADVAKYFEANKTKYQSLPEFDGMLVYAPYVVMKPATPTEEEMKEHYEGMKQNYVDDDGKELPFDEVKDEIRKELSTKPKRDEEAAIAKAQTFYQALLAALNADPETYMEGENIVENRARLFREEAKKAGLAIDDSFKGITSASLPETGHFLEKDMIGDFTDGKHGVGDFTRPIPGSDCASVFLITAYRPAEQLPFEQVKDKATKDAVNQKKLELAHAAAVDFAGKFEKLEDKAAGIVELVESTNGIWSDEITVARMDISGVSDPSAKNVLYTGIGKLSPPENGLKFDDGEIRETVEYVFITAHKPASAEEIAARKEIVTEDLNLYKQELAVRGFNDWWGSTLSAPFANNQSGE